jgi:hypothetical protein
MSTLKFGSSILLALAAMNSASAATMVVGGPGGPGDADCVPFGTGCGLEFQQVYDSSLFASTMTITGLIFYNQNYDPGSVSTAFYNISFSTTSRSISTLSSTFGDNLGLDNTLFYGGVLGGLIGPSNQFTITGTGFTYDPTQGNLLLHITSDGSGTEDSVFLDYASSNPANQFSRLFSFDSSGIGNDPTPNEGLVTGFVYSSQSDMPEPGSVWLMIGGGAVLIGLSRTRRRS